MPHGMVYGKKPSRVGLIAAEKLEDYMSKRIRISVTVQGKVIAVTKSKGGWFIMDAGQGRTIAAHLVNYKLNIPKALKGRIILMEGVAQKLFIADDMQHFAGDTVIGARQHQTKTNPKQRLGFEVWGIEIVK